jgi:hypothetical protein
MQNNMNFLKSINDTYHNRFDPSVARGVIDFLWYGAIRLSFLMLAVSLVVGGWLLFDAKTIVTARKVSEGGVETVSRTQLIELVTTFTNRTLQYSSLKKGGAAIVDPAR